MRRTYLKFPVLSVKILVVSEDQVAMPRGPKKHLKRLAAPKAWMLAKLGGAFTIKSSSGPHKQSASLPITLFIRLASLIVARS